MKLSKPSLLNSAFISPEYALSLSLPDWSLLIAQAKCTNVLPRLGYLFERAGLLQSVPAQPLRHIQSSLIFFQRFECALQWEINCIENALKSLEIPLIYLKGSAYHVADNFASQGRLFSDVDILVPEERLPEVEIALINAGWMTTNFDPYDQKYYRQWMHEIPPMRHLKRKTSIDVHHNILPKTCKFSPNAQALLANIVKIPEQNAWVLAPEDRVLHSATHLLNGGEFEQGFRDLSDLDLLLREFAAQDHFWDKLLERAQVLNQVTALRYALRYTQQFFNTPIPADMIRQANQLGKAHLSLSVADALFTPALQPNHPSCEKPWTAFARFCLFVRSHWLKMPASLLIPHLFKKSLKQLQELRNPKL